MCLETSFVQSGRHHFILTFSEGTVELAGNIWSSYCRTTNLFWFYRASFSLLVSVKNH